MTIETFSAELNLAQPQEIELYAGIFDQMAAVASYGRSARAIITKVIDDFLPPGYLARMTRTCSTPLTTDKLINLEEPFSPVRSFL